MNHGLIPYIGGKHRLANRISTVLRDTGADTMVDVFGGSAAVILAAGFNKRIYNDADGDLVNLFQVVRDPKLRQALARQLRWTPPAREVFEADRDAYVRGGLSFRAIADPVERARATFYRHTFSFGGKVRSGGFSVSVGDRYHIKEVGKYRNATRKLAAVGAFFRATLIENLHYSDVISRYGDRKNTVLYCDPPYDGTENYYSIAFNRGDHTFLAHQLAGVQAHVVVSYYETPLIRSLYPDDRWDWRSLQATKNSALRKGNKVIANEYLIVKKGSHA